MFLLPLLLTSTSILCNQKKKTLDMILVFLHLLILILWPNIRFKVDSILYTFEKNVCSVAGGWNILQIPVQFTEFKMQLILFLISFLSK